MFSMVENAAPGKYPTRTGMTAAQPGPGDLAGWPAAIPNPDRLRVLSLPGTITVLANGNNAGQRLGDL